MNDETGKADLLAAEQAVHLLREIVKWRRANQVSLKLRFWEGREYWLPGNRIVSFDDYDIISFPDHRFQIGVGVMSDRRVRRVMWYPVRTMSEAVDILVALGCLPPRFSSAYRAGWDARLNVDLTARELGEWDAMHYAADKLPAVKAA